MAIHSPSFAAETTGVAEAAADRPATRWFVELASPPAADGTARTKLALERRSFRKAVRAARLAMGERYVFETLWHGLSVEADGETVAELAALPGVKAIYPVLGAEMPSPDDGDLGDPAAPREMIGADRLFEERGLTGEGIRVGVIDTGIDYHHPALGGCFGPGCKVAVGHDFVGDLYRGAGSGLRPDQDPDDCAGHGTHVAGILAAESPLVTGIAPGVTLGAYRVFGCAGETSADVVVAAMERALADGMDVVNLSIVADYEWPEYPTAKAGDRLVNAGVVVVGAAGNAGGDGLYSGAAPGVGRKVIGTASVENRRILLPVVELADGTQIGHRPAELSPPVPTAGTGPLMATGTPTTPDDACAPLPAGSLAGRIALVRRGTCSFNLKATHVEAAGGVAAILYNNADGRFSANLAGPAAVGIPVVAISRADGLALAERLAAGPVAVTWTDRHGAFDNPLGGGLVSPSSAWGLGPELELEPDLAAPGGRILSTYPLELGGYATLSGTSMAAPHVAAAAALVLEGAPRMPAQRLGRFLARAAVPLAWSGDPAAGALEPVHHQGAGLLDVHAAFAAPLEVEPQEIVLGDDEDRSPRVRRLRIANHGGEPLALAVVHQPALATGPGTFEVEPRAAFAQVEVVPASLVVKPGGIAEATVTITPPSVAELPDQGLYGGYLALVPKGGGHASRPLVRVAYAGMVGDLQAIPILDNPSGFPWLTRRIGSTYYNQPDGATFSLEGAFDEGELPIFIVHLTHQVRRLRLEAFDADTGRARHRILDRRFVPRSSGPSSFTRYEWDGTVRFGKATRPVPDGRYVVRLTVVEAGGEPDDPEHVETWTSPVVTIDRP